MTLGMRKILKISYVIFGSMFVIAHGVGIVRLENPDILMGGLTGLKTIFLYIMYLTYTRNISFAGISRHPEPRT